MDVLMECLERGTAPVNVVAFAEEYLEGQGFAKLAWDAPLETVDGGKYYVTPFPDVLFAFIMDRGPGTTVPARMAFAHVDQPGFKVKGKPDFKNMGCAMMNVEVYGGMNDHTWFDRPLGMAGLVMLRGEDPFEPVPVAYDSRRPVAVIPGLAIHMDREALKGWKIDRQKELMPLTGFARGDWTEERFLHFLARELKTDVGEILAWDLNLYNRDLPEICGFEKDILCSPRLDNLVSVTALLESIGEAEATDHVKLIGLFNHEEVGSVSKSGARSFLLRSVLERIYAGKGCSPESWEIAFMHSSFLSVDGAHGAHPNYPDKCDPTTRALLGRGAVLKVNTTQKYASDCRMSAIIKELADRYDISLQEINDRNTIRGGATIGPMVGADLPMPGCDIGAPMLAMHSARETMAADDYESLYQLISAYFF